MDSFPPLPGMLGHWAKGGRRVRAGGVRIGTRPAPFGAPSSIWPPASTEVVRAARLRGDLSLVAQGIEVAAGFGVRSLEGLVSVAELLEHSVYEPASLHTVPGGVSFVLRNPPLRMGAFSALRLLWNGSPVPPGACTVLAPPEARPRRFSEIDRSAPITLPIGRRSRFFAGVVPGEGSQRVRLELQSVAIPPKVWLEFSDEVRPGGDG